MRGFFRHRSSHSASDGIRLSFWGSLQLEICGGEGRPSHVKRGLAKPWKSCFSWFRDFSGQIRGGFSPKGVAPRNVQMTRRAYKLLAVLIKSNSEAESS